MPADLEAEQAGILDTDILIHWERLPARLLPDVGAVTAITFAELAAGVHAALGAAELAERVDKLQRVESAFEPIPFDGDAARAFALYESVRIPRTARIVWSTREMGRVYHAAGVERQVRNLLWKGKTQSEFYRGIEWLYGWKEDNCLEAR